MTSALLLIALMSTSDGTGVLTERVPTSAPGKFQGKFIVASDKVKDPDFSGRTLFIVVHDDNGAIGIVLDNAPMTDHKSEYDERSCGPVRPGAIVAVIDRDLNPVARTVAGRIAVSGEVATLEHIVQTKDPRHIVCWGYAGWEKGQLEREMRAGAWQLSRLEADALFRVPATKIGARARAKVPASKAPARKQPK